MTDEAKGKNECWLEIEAEIKNADHPIFDLRSWLHPLRDILVALFVPAGTHKGQEYLLELSSPFGRGLLFSLKKAIESRKEQLGAKGKESEVLGVEIVNDSFRTVGERDVVNCWIRSPIFDLVIPKSRSILHDYRWASGNPSEYFFIYGNKDIFLKTLLPTLYQEAGNSTNRIHWKFYSTPKRSRYEGLSLREDYYFNVALRKRYFESFNDSLLEDLRGEIAAITGTERRLDELGEEMLSIASKAFASPKVTIAE